MTNQPPKTTGSATNPASAADARIVSAEQFLKGLSESGLLSVEEVKAFIARVPAAQRQNTRQLAQELLRQQKLTRYQASLLCQGKSNGLVLGNYAILDKIGAGGMGMVFKAQHRHMNRVVALKVLTPSVTKSPTALQRFRREVEAAARLHHPNIVAAYDANEDKGAHFLVMEFVDGSDLSQLVKKQGPLPVKQAVDCVMQTARGLEHAHAAGIIHRDIKPANLILTTLPAHGSAGGVIKILDMGLARFEDSGNEPGKGAAPAELTQTGSIMGTCDYMSPEQALNTRRADQRSDIYSLGCTFYYLLTAKSLYGGETMMERLMAHREAAIPPLRDVRPDVPESLDAIYRRMVAKKPEDRFVSMTEVVAALEECAPKLAAGAAIIAGAGSAGPGISGSPEHAHTLVGIGERTAMFFQNIGSSRSGRFWPLLRAGLLTVLVVLRFCARATLAAGRYLVIGPATPLKWAARAAAVVLCLLLLFFSIRAATDRGELTVEAGDPEVAAVLDRDGLTLRLRDTNRTVQLKKGPHTLKSGAYDIVVASLPADVEVTPSSFTIQRGDQLAMKVKFSTSYLDAKALDEWCKSLANLPPDQQIEKVVAKLRDRNPGYDGRPNFKIDQGQVVELVLNVDMIADIAPVRALSKLRILTCTGNGLTTSKFSDLAPLVGMKQSLRELNCIRTNVANLAPLKGLQLQKLNCFESRVADLSPLADMPLRELSCSGTPVTDLSPLAGMKLTVLRCSNAPIADLAPLQGMPLQQLYLSKSKVTDLAPLRGMSLKTLYFDGTTIGSLEPLRGMPLSEVRFDYTPVADLAPLRGAPLTNLYCGGTKVSDLSLLRDLPIVDLRCFNTKVSDLSPLRGKKMRALNCENTQVSSLAPLEGMPLTFLNCKGTKVVDLSVLQGMPLTYLNCAGTQVTDLSPIRDMPLKELVGDFRPDRDFEIVRSLKALERLNGKPVGAFFKDR